MKKYLPIEKRVEGAYGCQEIERIKSEHAYLHALGHSREEWDYLWVRSPNATWAHRFGKMIGFPEIWLGCVIDMDRQVIQAALKDAVVFPETATKDYRSVGATGIHSLASAVVEVADDAETGRSYCVTSGTMGFSFSSRTKTKSCSWMWERYGSDFCCVDGEWFYFHEQVCPDLGGNYGLIDPTPPALPENAPKPPADAGGPGGPGGPGEGGGPGGPGGMASMPRTGDWARDAYLMLVNNVKSPLDPAGGGPEKITERGLTHRGHGTLQVIQNTVPYPHPYATMDDDNTYSVGRTKV